MALQKNQRMLSLKMMCSQKKKKNPNPSCGLMTTSLKLVNRLHYHQRRNSSSKNWLRPIWNPWPRTKNEKKRSNNNWLYVTCLNFVISKATGFANGVVWSVTIGTLSVLCIIGNRDDFPSNTQRNKHIIITSKRRFDVIITCLLRCVFEGSLCEYILPRVFNH